MPKKKYPKLPNGFGSIKKLSGKRTNPYGVYPPTTEFAPNGSPKTPKAICYVPDWHTGFYALMEYNNGKFKPENFIFSKIKENSRSNDVISKIIASYNGKTRSNADKKTFSEVYQLYYAYKYERKNGKNYSKASMHSTRAAYLNCAALHDEIFSEITAAMLQKIIDECPLKHASKELIVTLIRQMYKYAFSNNICDRDYSTNLAISTPDDDEKGVSFTEDELSILWGHAQDNSIIQGILIMIYSGFRISAYKTLKINKEEQYFQGGVKTAAGKNRIVPFNNEIISFINPDIELFTVRGEKFRTLFYEELSRIGIEKHTPHDCRHTFSWLCDKYKVDPLSKKLLLGHNLGNDVTDAVYGHRTIDELRLEINKITK